MVASSSTGISDPSQLAPGLFVAGAEPRASDEPPAPDPLVGQLLDSRYRVIERLAEGGMGTVYRAEHVALHKEVAIKLVLDADNSDHAMRFLREAMLTSRIDHPNVISAIDYGTFDQGAPYLVMNLVEGPTLAHVVKFEAPIAWTRAAEIGAQIADAVAAAQAQGIVHRDLKPENVVLQQMPDGTEVAKVLDFGIAKYARDSLAPPQVRDAQHVTRMGVVVGTPGYMAPEQAIGMRADHRADLYSIGVMLWECVVGRQLWDGRDVQQLMTAQLSRRPPRVRTESGDPSIPEAFETLIAELLATRPENRPESAVETRDRLRAILEAGRRESQERVNSSPVAQADADSAARPPDTDTVFIDAAIVGWRGAADRSAGAERAEPPPTRVLPPVVISETVEQPTTQIGFRSPAPIAQRDVASEGDANALSLDELAPEELAIEEGAIDPASVADESAGRPRAAFRRHLPVALALGVLSVMLWAALDSSSSPSDASARVRPSHVMSKAERSGASRLDGTRGAPAPVPWSAANDSAPTASRTLPLSASGTPQTATRTSSQAAALTRAPASTKPRTPGVTARASSEAEVASGLRTKARTSFRRAQFELAAQTYRLAIKAAPEYPGAYAGLGASQLALGDAHGAIASYKLAIRRSPGTSGFHAALGRAYLMARDRSRALAEYRKAVALDPANEIASKALAALTP